MKCCGRHAYPLWGPPTVALGAGGGGPRDRSGGVGTACGLVRGVSSLGEPFVERRGVCVFDACEMSRSARATTRHKHRFAWTCATRAWAVAVLRRVRGAAGCVRQPTTRYTNPGLLYCRKDTLASCYTRLHGLQKLHRKGTRALAAATPMLRGGTAGLTTGGHRRGDEAERSRSACRMHSASPYAPSAHHVTSTPSAQCLLTVLTMDCREWVVPRATRRRP